jgi:hypothetical protein
MTHTKQAGDKGAGLLPWVQGLAPARRDSYRDGRGSTPAHQQSIFLHSDNRGQLA